MRKAQVSNGICDTPITNRSVDSGNDIDEVFTRAATESQSVPESYLDWCYDVSTDWIWWYLVSKSPKEVDGRISNVGSTPARVDSGVGLYLLGHENGRPSRSATSAPPTPITLHFRFNDGTITKHVPYPAFSNWPAINALLYELKQDSIIVHKLWDVNEDMPIDSGDWNARIHPGSVIDAWCCNDERGYQLGDFDDSSNSGDDTDGNEDEIQGDNGVSWNSSVVDLRNENTWWFARWRERVEREGVKREGVNEGPSWCMMVIWCTSIVAGIVVSSLIC